MATEIEIMNKHPLPMIGDRMLVTLRSPVVVFLQGTPRSVPTFEGELVNQSSAFVVFSTMRMFSKTKNAQKSRDEVFPIAMRVDLTIPFDNLAGMLPMPKAS